MTFEEFRHTYGMYGAYVTWTTVFGAKELGYIPDKYFPYFPDKCECGSDNIISSSLKQEMCCDPKCVIKTGYQTAEFLHEFGIEGLGPAGCLKIYKAFLTLDEARKKNGGTPVFRYGSYLEMFLVPWEEYPLSIADTAIGQLFFLSGQSIQQRVLTFPELISKLRIPSVHGKAASLFTNINSFSELSSSIHEVGGIQKFCWSRGFYDPVVAFNLKVCMPDIAVADFIFRDSIRNIGLRYITVSITGRLFFKGAGVTKSNFIQMCNALCCDSNGVQVYEVVMNSSVESNPFIIYSTPSNSTKYNRGLARGSIKDEFGHHDVLVTADWFYNMLERLMGKWEEQLRRENSGTDSKVISSKEQKIS